MRKLYILRDQSVQPAHSPEEWAVAFETRRELVKDVVGDIQISTVFIGVDDCLFETRTSLHGVDKSYRSSTLAEAQARHDALLADILDIAA